MGGEGGGGAGHAELRAVEHVAQEALDRHVAHGLPEEELLQGARAEGADRGQQQQQATQPRPPPHGAVLGHHGVRLVRQRLHLQRVAKPPGFWNHRGTQAKLELYGKS